LNSLSSRRPQPRGPVRLPVDSLAASLLGAADTLSAVRDGQALPEALAEIQQRNPQLNAGAVQDLAYHVLRYWAACDAVLGSRVKQMPPPMVRELLTVALALIAPLGEEGLPLAGRPPHYAAHTVVDQAVEACRSRRETVGAAGLVNAVLRAVLREGVKPWLALRSQPVAWHNAPLWWQAALKRAYPRHWQAVLQAARQSPPMTLRVNQRVMSAEKYLSDLNNAGLQGALVHGIPTAITLTQPIGVQRLPGFAEGHVSVQDAGAQYAAAALDVKAGQRVLDACAAPGGKSAHILECADVQLTALEIDASRAQRIQENIERLRPTLPETLMPKVIVGDANEPKAWWDGQLFDRILADVPCSASGIVRRHPDIMWLRRETDIPALVRLQRRILTALWPLLKSGGRLLYVTCSVFPEEGEAQARWFEGQYADALRLPAPGQWLTEGVLAQGHAAASPGDAFFYALFEKR
jgi:16S rRNA (cytosine967-C5)-methyltransferase